jgi:UDP-N-acetylmuramoylalanine--D-glutamate ligase
VNFLRDQSFLILGLGDSGLAMARWVRRCGAADGGAWPTPAVRRLRRASWPSEVPGAELRCGALTEDLLDGMQWLLKSPGLSPLDPAAQPLLQAAEARGLQVLGELALFAHALADLKAARGYAPKVLAITGTNGKTTTTSLTALLCERAGQRVGLAGNIGPTLLDTLSAALDLEPEPAAAADEAEGPSWPKRPKSPRRSGQRRCGTDGRSGLGCRRRRLEWLQPMRGLPSLPNPHLRPMTCRWTS